ncbi:MAG TPA: lysylphosphatidylglycerol synthase domain-containing protein [Gaiellaceae bacterium]|nr:lysylphosphatidylglycerol synthase domain-containing protein [Gaiellaceae bacterium]
MGGEEPSGSRWRGALAPIRTHHLESELRHLGAWMVLGGAIALAAAAAVAWHAGFHAVVAHLRHVGSAWLLLALTGAAAAHLGYVLAYREIAHVDEGLRISARRAGALVVAGFGMFTPRGGFAVDIEALEDLGVPGEEARIRVLGLGSLEYVVLATASCVCAWLLLLRDADAQQAVTLSWAVGVPGGTGLALLALRFRDVLCRGILQRPLSPAFDAIEMVGKVLASPRRHGVAALVGMSLYFAAEVFVLWACVAAFTGRLPSIEAVVVGYATGYALTRRTLPLAGAGAVEALLPFALAWVGFALAPAILATVAYRIFNLWLPLGPAAAGLIALRRRRVSDARRSPSSRS